MVSQAVAQNKSTGSCNFLIYFLLDCVIKKKNFRSTEFVLRNINNDILKELLVVLIYMNKSSKTCFPHYVWSGERICNSLK